MNTQMELFTKGEFSTLYRNVREDKGMLAVMSQMQAPYGINERKAYENADAIIRLVAAHENASNMLSEDAMEVLNTFLKESERMRGYDRRILLHQLYFGLKLYQDEELIEQVKEGTGESALFREYYTRCGEDPAITEAMLEEDIRKLMGNYRISPKAMRVIVRQMEKNQNLRATASALGEDGMRFKCIVAMDLYLRNKDTMTMEQAVNIACTNVQLQAVADAVSRGQITEERAKIIFVVVAMVFILCSIALALYAPHIAKAAAGVLMDPTWITANLETFAAADLVTADFAVGTAAAKIKTDVVMAKDGLLFGGLALAAISDKVAEWMGRIAANRTYVRSAAEANTADAMENMISHIEAETEETAAEPVAKEAAETAHQKKTAAVFA